MPIGLTSTNRAGSEWFWNEVRIYFSTFTIDISSVRRKIGVPVQRNIRASAQMVFCYFSGTVKYAGIVMGD